MDRLLQAFCVARPATADQCNDWINQHVYGERSSDKELVHVGFDTESKPYFPPSSGVVVEDDDGILPPSLALIQIATQRRHVLLYHVYGVPDAMSGWPAQLIRLVQDARVHKHCVDTRGDLRELFNVGLAPVGFFDVQIAAQTRLHTQARLGMRQLAHELLGVDLEKSASMSTSDWSKRPLSLKQMTYAACDAVISLALAESLLVAPSTGMVFSDSPATQKLESLDYSKPVHKLLAGALHFLLPLGASANVSDLIAHPRLRRLFVDRHDMQQFVATNPRKYHLDDDIVTRTQKQTNH